MAKTKIHTTPKGVIYYPHLRTPEVFEGEEVGFTAKIMFDAETTNKFFAHLEAALEEAEAAFPGKSFKNASLGSSEDKDGNTMFKFKANTSFKTKAGDTIHRTIPIYDSNGKPLDEKADIGTGSIVRIAYSIYPYWKSAKTNGLSLRLEAVQVIEYKPPYSRDAAGFGFEVEEGGYTTADEDTGLGVPFDTNEDEGADF